MSTPVTKRYGEWTSPITSECITSSSIKLGAPTVLTDNTGAAHLFWLEGRPLEKGRQVLVRYSVADARACDVTPAGDWNVRTRVHEYGGGDYLISGGKVFFSNFADQRLWQQDAFTASDPVPLTPADAALRFADATLDERRSRIICVMEDHSESTAQPRNCIAAVALGGSGSPAPPQVPERVSLESCLIGGVCNSMAGRPGWDGF